MQKAIKELLKMNINTADELTAAKRKVAKKYKIGILENSEIIKEYRWLVKAGEIRQSRLQERLLRKRAVRTLSGIAPVAVLTKPYPCPGRCVYCPTEPGVPQSYLSNEPAVMRAIRCNYHPYVQVQDRIRALVANGHEPAKIELIVIGGTWSVLPTEYKHWFISECFRGANEFRSKNLEVRNKKEKELNFRKTEIFEFKGGMSQNQIQSQLSQTTPGSSLFKKGDNFNASRSIRYFKNILLAQQKRNEKARYRIVGITLETRPDYIDEREILEMRELGCTRVEIGVQALDDKILKLNRRGHGVDAVVAATKLLKDYGFKVTYHIMPGLPGATPSKDLTMFKQLFTDERFQPDQIKFYPTVVTKGSLLYKWWRAGKYKPYSAKVLEKLIADCKRVAPPYVRIIRLIRDIPGESIIAGNLVTNLRQVMQARGVKCLCIRCREARELPIADLRFSIIKYQASGGEEYFLEFTDKTGKVLYGFCRLRLPHKDTECPIGHSVSIARELHVYGELVSVGSKKKVQHAGLGKKLLKEAERIAKQEGYKKIAVISGVGVRDYYRRQGYRLNHTYMVKKFQ